MGVSLNFYPQLDDKLYNMIGYSKELYKASYTNENTTCKLELENSDGTHIFEVRDDKCCWEPDTFNLKLNQTYIINNPEFLFGKDGIVCENAEIGLAVLWMSKTSNQRGVEIISTINKNSIHPLKSNLNIEFDKGQIKGQIRLRTVLYLKNKGIPQSGEEYLCNIEGAILGELDEDEFIIDGNGSVFPIVQVDQQSSPLWWVNCDWQDPMIDEFSEENVRICLNSAHPNFKKLNIEKGLKESPLLLEIIASAIQIIIEKIKDSEDINEILSGNGFDEGSIAAAVYYFKETFDLDISSSERLAISLRKYLDNRI